jgi:hypothetical protein
MTRGFFAIGIVNGKTHQNIGTLLRSAYLYDAAFVFTIGKRYDRQASSSTSVRCRCRTSSTRSAPATCLAPRTTVCPQHNSRSAITWCRSRHLSRSR